MTVVRIGVLAVATAAMISDLRTGKIGNGIIAAGLISALTIHLLRPGTFWLSATGAAVPLVLGWPLFRFRMIGAGDVKLLMTIGALIGVTELPGFLISVLVAGGILSLIFMIAFTGMRERAACFLSWVRDGVRYGNWRPYRSGGVERMENFHFSVPVLMAAVIYAGGLL